MIVMKRSILVLMLLILCCLCLNSRAQKVDTIGHNSRVIYSDKVSRQVQGSALNGLTQGQAQQLRAVPMRRMAVAEAPHYPGGADSMLAFMQRNLRYPEEAKAKQIQGVVMVSFVVDTNGAISNIRIRQDIGGGCAPEAVRVVAAMPYWVPARNVAGYRVRTETVVPVRFALDNMIPGDVNLDPDYTAPDETEERTSVIE
jgi:TonB family protein